MHAPKCPLNDDATCSSISHAPLNGGIDSTAESAESLLAPSGSVRNRATSGHTASSRSTTVNAFTPRHSWVSKGNSPWGWSFCRRKSSSNSEEMTWYVTKGSRRSRAPAGVPSNASGTHST